MIPFRILWNKVRLLRKKPKGRVNNNYSYNQLTDNLTKPEDMSRNTNYSDSNIKTYSVTKVR